MSWGTNESRLSQSGPTGRWDRGRSRTLMPSGELTSGARRKASLDQKAVAGQNLAPRRSNIELASLGQLPPKQLLTLMSQELAILTTLADEPQEWTTTPAIEDTRPSVLIEGSSAPNFIARWLQVIAQTTRESAIRIAASIDGEPVEAFVLADDEAKQLFLLQDHIGALIEFLSFAWHYVPVPYKRGLSTALTSLTVLFLITSCATGGERPALPTVVPPVAALTEPEPASGQPPLPSKEQVDQGASAPTPELPAEEQSASVIVAPTTTTGETPTPLAALRAEGVGGAVLTSEQLAESARTFAQFTGLEGLTASQPELREGDPDFLARTIVFVDSQGKPVGMVVAIRETEQVYIWRDASGKIVCQPTDQTQPLEGEACDAAIAEYWDPSLAAMQEQSAEQGAAEVEQAQSWTVLTQEEITERLLVDPESNTKIREQAKYVLGADRLSDEAFAAGLGRHMVEMTTDVDDKPRTNMVVGVVEGKTDFGQVHAAITAAREQGLKLLGSTLLYVTHDADGAMRIWHTGTFTDKGANSWIAASYQGLQTFVGFISVNPETGETTLNDVSKDNYWLLGMGSLDDYTNKRIGGPARFEFRVQFNPDGSSSMLSVSPIDKAFEFVSDPASPGGYRWKSYATPDMRENGAAEIMPSLDKINVVLAELDTITAQSAEPNWHQAELLDYQGSKYLEVRDTRQDRVAYLVYVDVDETTGKRLYGPVVLVNSGNFDPNSTNPLVLDHEPLTDLQLALSTISSIGRSNLIHVMQDNNILLFCASRHLTDQQSSHRDPNAVVSPINAVYFNLKTFTGDTQRRAYLTSYVTIGEIFEILGHMYFAQGSKPPVNGFFFTLHQDASHLPVESDSNADLYNAWLNAKRWLNTNQHSFTDIIDALRASLDRGISHFQKLAQ